MAMIGIQAGEAGQTAGQPGGAGPAAQRPQAFGRIFRAVRSNRKATAGAILLAIFCVLAAIPGLIAHDNPEAEIYRPSLGPSMHHLLGTTSYGQDLFAQVVWGTRETLIIALVSGLLSTFLSVLMGLAAAYLGGAWDHGLNFITDVLLVIPSFPLLIIIAAYLPNAGNNVLILVLTFTGWSYTARQLRSQAQSIRNRDFLLAARVRGERPLYIIVVEILPTMTSLLLASFLNNALYAVLAGSGLQFIGLGNSNNVSWGTTLYWAQQNNALGSHLYAWAVVPGACIALLGAAFAFINYAFDEIGNPALRPLTAAKARKAALASMRRRRASHGASAS
jgi:peptide/nickel transport system permease protein